MHLPRDSVITFEDIYPRKVKTYIHRKTCAWVFIVAFFVILAKYKKQPASPWVGGGLHTSAVPAVCIQGSAPGRRRGKWYSLHTAAWVDLKGVTLSVKNYISKRTYYMIPHT